MNQTRADGPLTRTPAETVKRLLNTSLHVAETFDREGISPKSVVAQQQLINDLTKLLEQSGRAKSPADAPTQSQFQNSDTSDQRNSNPPQGTQSSSTAGQAPVAQVLPNIDIGNLDQRENFADAVWGHLPPRERNDLLRTYSESYLPGYENRVQRYFEKLAKLRHRRPDKSSMKIEHVSPPRR